MKHTLIILSLMFCLACSSSSQTEGESKTTPEETTQVTLKKVNTAEMKALMADESIQVVDVRTPAETSAGHIEGAMIGMDFMTGEFEQNLSKLDTARPVVVYCARGGRSAKAAAILKEKGFKTVYDYTDGYTGWANQ
ncbi:MAG: rhodanese-like domain-containing protein [Fulvivirga sp.]